MAPRSGKSGKFGKWSQQGSSLISLLVGLLLALISTVVMMGLYKVALRSVFGSDGVVRNARQDSALASGLLSAQIGVQEAGFGIASAAAGEHFLALKTASFAVAEGTLDGTVQAVSTTEAAVEAVLWESNPAQVADTGTWDCKALWSGLSAAGQPVLYLLEAAKPCHPVASNFKKLKWSYTALVPEQHLPTPVGLRVQRVDACWPFGAVPTSISGLPPSSGTLQLRLISRNSSRGTGAEAADRPFLICLPNFKS